MMESLRQKQLRAWRRVFSILCHSHGVLVGQASIWPPQLEPEEAAINCPTFCPMLSLDIGVWKGQGISWVSLFFYNQNIIRCLRIFQNITQRSAVFFFFGSSTVLYGEGGRWYSLVPNYWRNPFSPGHVFYLFNRHMIGFWGFFFVVVFCLFFVFA